MAAAAELTTDAAQVAEVTTAQETAAAIFKGMFVRRRSPTTRRAAGDRNASLHELALRVIVAQCDAVCPADAILEEVHAIADALAEWPSTCYEWVLPRVHPRLLVACQQHGLPHDHTPAATALRAAASAPLLDNAILREEQRFRAWRAAHRPGEHTDGDETPAEDDAPALPLIDCFSEWGRLLSSSVAPSLPPSQLLFAHERAAIVEPLSASAFEASVGAFELNYDAFTGSVLTGLECVLGDQTQARTTPLHLSRRCARPLLTRQPCRMAQCS
jgi:hypothetical protein